MADKDPIPRDGRGAPDCADRVSEWLTVEAAARELQRSTRTVGRMLQHGILTKLPGRRVRIPREDVEKITGRSINTDAGPPTVALNVEEYVAFRLNLERKEDLLQVALAKLAHVEGEMKIKDAKIRSLERHLKRSNPRNAQADTSIVDDLVKSVLIRLLELKEEGTIHRR